MKRYALIGCPLVHSASAEYFADKFAHESIIDSTYSLYELEDIDHLESLIASEAELCGFNVTIPYKQQIIPYLDDVSFEAMQIGAVNCVKIIDGKLKGYNTDAVGFRYSLAKFLDSDIPERALILGTGGASQAVQFVLAEMGIMFEIVSRSEAKGNYTYDNLPSEVVSSHRLIVNTTPVGMFPHTEEAPRIPYAFVSPNHYLLDLIYNPTLTQFLDYGSQRGARVCNGHDMFIRQAEESWRIWNN